MGDSRREARPEDRGPLADMARLGGHRAGGFDEAEEVVSSLLSDLKPRRTRALRTYSLWDNYLILLMAVGLLLVEWVWRKRQGLP